MLTGIKFLARRNRARYSGNGGSTFGFYLCNPGIPNGLVYHTAHGSPAYKGPCPAGGLSQGYLGAMGCVLNRSAHP